MPYKELFNIPPSFLFISSSSSTISYFIIHFIRLGSYSILGTFLSLFYTLVSATNFVFYIWRDIDHVRRQTPKEFGSAWYIGQTGGQVRASHTDITTTFYQIANRPVAILIFQSLYPVGRSYSSRLRHPPITPTSLHDLPPRRGLCKMARLQTQLLPQTQQPTDKELTPCLPLTRNLGSIRHGRLARDTSRSGFRRGTGQRGSCRQTLLARAMPAPTLAFGNGARDQPSLQVRQMRNITGYTHPGSPPCLARDRDMNRQDMICQPLIKYGRHTCPSLIMSSRYNIPLSPVLLLLLR